MSALRGYRPDAHVRRWRRFHASILEELRAAHEDQRLTLTEFGELADMHRSQLRLLLNGESSHVDGPRLRTLFELAHALDMEVEITLRPRANGHARPRGARVINR